MVTPRERLPQRRRCETINMQIPGLSRQIVMTVGYYDDGRPGEVFVSDVKAGTQADAITRDAAVCLSFCMQYGTPLKEIANALTRNPDNSASSIIGVLLDKLLGEHHD
jgi:hypothetical protein